MKNRKLKSALLSTAALIAVAATFTSTGSVAGNSLAAELAPVVSLIDDVASTPSKTSAVTPNTLKTKTPIKHLVVVFNENRSFDHYFGTYPNALNVGRRAGFRARQEHAARHQQSAVEPGAARQQPERKPERRALQRRYRHQPPTAPMRPIRSASTARRPTRPVRTTAIRPSNWPTTTARTTSSRSTSGNGTSGGAGAFGTKGQVMGYLRRQHRHRVLELRPEFRDERQCLE